MANHLSVTKSNAIEKLRQQGQSQRQVAETLSVDRKTVRRHLAVASTSDQAEPQSSGTTAPTGSDVTADLKSGATVAATSASDSEPFREIIEAKYQQGLHALRIFQDMQDEHDFSRQQLERSPLRQEAQYRKTDRV